MPLDHNYSPHSKAIITAGAAVMILLIILLTVIGLGYMTKINERMNQVIEVHNKRADLLFSMRRIVRERSLAMYAIYLTQDPFDRDDEFIRFRGLAEQFIKARQQLESMGMSGQQQREYQAALDLIKRSAPLQNSIIDMILRAERLETYRLMSVVDLPLEKQILSRFDRLIELERIAATRSSLEASQQYHQAFFYMWAMGGLIVVVSILITVWIIRRTTKIENDLYAAKEQAEVTLHALGEAVITTDSKQNVIYLNPAAELLTGWKLEHAKGQPLNKVYHLRETSSHSSASIREQKLLNKGDDNYVLRNRSTNSEYIIQGSNSPISDKDGNVVGSVLIARDVTYEHQLASQLSWQASHDALTGLLNRREFELRVERLLNATKINPKQHALLYLDLDQFKLVNDTCGHIAGDELLRQLSGFLKLKIRGSDTLARLGGDEFGVILENCDLQRAIDVAGTLIDAVQEFRFFWNQKSFAVGVSVGLVEIDEHSRDLATILSAADAACYTAKDKGRNQVWVHQSDDSANSQRHGDMQWITRLKDALNHQQFELYIQKVMPLQSTEGSTYHELLLRLNDLGELTTPMAFIPTAERYGLMRQLDRWVVETAFDWLLNNTSSVNPADVFAVNISGQSIGDDSFLEYCRALYEKTQIHAGQICFEITETAAVANWTHAHHFVQSLKQLGFKFALDDFGSGMSSFSYLKSFDVDYIKIDGIFVKDMLTDHLDKTTVKVINIIGKEMGIKTIAEHVEHPQSMALLKELHVDYAQGYILHTPEPLCRFHLNQNPGRLDASSPSL